MISKAIENAQRKVEGHNFDIRKHLLEYDDVMNEQRKEVYGYRLEVLGSQEVKSIIEDMIGVQMEGVAQEFYQEKVLSADWDWPAINERLQGILGFIPEWQEEDKQDLTLDSFIEKLQKIAEQAYAAQEEAIGTEGLRYLERVLLLQTVDTHWKEHLLNLDHLKEGIGLRGYGQKNPLQEYKKEGFEMFSAMIETIREQTLSTLFRIKLASEEDLDREAMEKKKREQSKMQMSRGRDAEQAQQPLKREGEKIGRNSPCPCGSGKKYKKCCGRTQ